MNFIFGLGLDWDDNQVVSKDIKTLVGRTEQTIQFFTIFAFLKYLFRYLVLKKY